MEFGTGAGLKSEATDPDTAEIIPNPQNLAEPLIEGTNIDNLDTWKTHIPKESLPHECELGFHQYWRWEMGGQKFYFPAPVGSRENKGFVATNSPADLTADSVNVDGVQAKQTRLSQVLTMEEWKAEGSTIGDYWVIDSDGWAYWASALNPGEATGLLLNRVSLISVPEEDYFYGINVAAQMATKDGDESDGELDNYLRFGDDINGGWTDDGQALMDLIVYNSGSIGSPDEEMYMLPLVADDIIIDPETGLKYVANQILISASEGTNREAIENLISGYDADIVGFIAITNDYQIKFADERSLTDLRKIVEHLVESPYVEFPSMHYVIETDLGDMSHAISNSENYSVQLNMSVEDVMDLQEAGRDFHTEPPNDYRWRNARWNNNYYGGLNWGLMAIRAPSAWYYNSRMSRINIGLIDGCFDTQHEDLTFSRVFNNAHPSGTYPVGSHGTHVAGVMAADSDNEIGISGIIFDRNLYGYSLFGERVDVNTIGMTPNFEIKYAIARLATRNVKVINLSFGLNRDVVYPAYRGEEVVIEHFTIVTRRFEYFLSRLFDAGFDFILVQAAGNFSNSTDGNGERPMGWVNAEQSNYFAPITNTRIRSRIITVGAIQHDGFTPAGMAGPSTFRGYSIAEFSHVGVDIMAPGVRIDSTVRNNSYGNEGWDGTSMAAPHVSGTVAMIWALYPNLTGDLVREAVVGSADRPVTLNGRAYGILNAAASVERAIQWETTLPSPPPVDREPTSIVMGHVVSDHTSNGIENVQIAVFSEDGTYIASTRTSSNDGLVHTAGEFELILPPGTYRIHFMPQADYLTEQIDVNVNRTVVVLPQVTLQRSNNNSPITSIRSLQTVSYALRADGTVWGWGRNASRSSWLGHSTETELPTPTQISGLTDAVYIAHNIALKSDGTVWTWGPNDYGQLGDGTRTNRLTPGRVSGLTDVISVVATSANNFALQSDGTVWAWGQNFRTTLGDGTSINRSTPVQVSGLTDVISIFQGSWGMFAIKSDGTVWAWGENTFGQLGNGTRTSSLVPVQVSGLTDVVYITGVGGHVVALRDDGTVWTWGTNGRGQLGVGLPFTERSEVPLQVPELTDIVSIASSGFTTYAIRSDGTVWAWGENGNGQVGNGTRSPGENSPSRVIGLTNISSIAVGSSFTLAKRSDGTVWAWGNNIYGSFGDGTTTARIYPSPVNGLTNVSSIITRSWYVVAIKSDGTAWVWGHRVHGLGDGSTDIGSSSPVPIRLNFKD